MRGSIRKWVVLGSLASASLWVAGCENRGQGVEVPGQPDRRELEPATGGAGQPDSVDPLERDHQPSLDEPAGAAEPRGIQQRGDADTGGAGYDVPQETGTQGQGVTGGAQEEQGPIPGANTGTEGGGFRSPDMPELDPKSDEERFRR